MLTFDTHSHLNFDDFENEQKKIIEENLKNNLWAINVGAEKESSQKAIELANKYHEGIYASVGIHPIHLFPAVKKEWERKVEKFDYDFYFDLIKNKKVVAIGEVGLDYHHFEEGQDIEKIKKLQKEIFLQFLNLTWKTDKALIIHCWEAYDDLLAIIENFIIEKKWNKKNKGIIHSFIGSWKMAEKFLNLDFSIGLNGIITYSNSYDKLIKNCPLEKIVVETDSPYLTPKPLMRNEKNEPKNVVLVAKKIAEIKNLSLEEVLKTTFKNAKEIFKV